MGGLTRCGGGRQEGGEDKEMSQEGDEGGVPVAGSGYLPLQMIQIQSEHLKGEL